MNALATVYACVLVAALLPYAWVAIAKTGAPRYDNRDPRDWLARQDAPRVRRAHAAHLNALEAFAPFAAAVVIAQLAGVAPATIAALAIGFVIARLGHGLAYLSGRAVLRSMAWLVGIACVVALFALAIAQAAKA